MEDSLKQALSDVELFLAGARAPALIGHSLATVVSQDVRVVASAVVRWVYGDPRAMQDRFAALLAARNKVFDIFFYRVVRFQRIFEFFPPFERALIRAVPPEDQARLTALLGQNPWKEIRPLGSFRDPQEFALEGRRDAPVSTEQFNEDLYRNATHQVLGADRRYTFDSPTQQEQIGRYQSQVAEVFDDFVNLIPDVQTKREIKLANAADKDAVYANRPKFQLEVYLCQLADLAIALINDEYFEHGVKGFATLNELATDARLNTHQMHRLQEKTTLFNLQKLGEYGSSKSGTFLLRDVLRLFARWQPDRLLHLLQESDDRRERKLALAMLEAYGREIYGRILESLRNCHQSSPWYYVRNLAYILGHIVTDDESQRATAVQLLAPWLFPGSARQLNQQVIQTYGFIGTEPAAEVLAGKLAEFKPLFGKDRDATDACHKILVALIAIETESSLRAAFDFCEQHELLEQYGNVFNRVSLPARMRSEVIARIRRELKKLKFTFSILGDSLTTRELLGVIGHSGQQDVETLCEEITSGFPARSELAIAARKAMQVPPPAPLMAADRTLHRLLVARDLPQIFCHLYESGGSGRVEIESRDAITGEVDVTKGEVFNSTVARYFLQGANAFEWLMLLEARDILNLRYDPMPALEPQRTTTMPTPDLLREALFQRGQVEQILDGVLSPEARYRRRDAHGSPMRFLRLDHPERYHAVWEALENEADIKTIQLQTKFNRYEVCKILFYFIRQNLISVVDAAKLDENVTLDDALMSIALSVKAIEAKPVQFQTYFAAAEACAYLRQHVADETIRSAARGLRNFFLDAYSSHRVFVAKHVELCTMTLGLMARYLKTRADAERRELLEFIAFSFGEQVDIGDAAVAPPSERTLMQKIESIDGANDPYDASESLFGEADLDGIFAAFDHVLTNVTGDSAAAPAAALSAHEENTLLELFGNIANAYVRPFKEFVRELDTNHKEKRPTTADWLEFALPSVALLSGAAEKMGYEKLHGILRRIERTMVEQRKQSKEGEQLPLLFCERILVDHHQLASALPSTFSLQMTDEELASRKEGLIVKFILRQIPEVDDLALNKIIFAGLGSFDRFMEIPSDEIAHVTGISRKLAESIYMKFYHYRDLYYGHSDPEKQTKFASVYDISLGSLRELNGQVEQLSRDEASRKPVDAAAKQAVIAERQRTLWSLVTLLCIKGEHDLVERIQASVYDERIRLLEDYFARAFATGAPAAS
ncbi:MAG TPA: hypothetical protein PLF26_10185 [Blastocatellia bacterium]|nr:hypothetical protein [Blastocatellia bacterium]